MSPIPEPTQKHVPAWKKLGLKLKFAKEEPEDIQLRQNGTPNRRKRKASAEEAEDVVEGVPVETSAKKPKKSKSRAKDAGEVVNGYGSSSYEPRNDVETRKEVTKSKRAADESAEAINGNSKPPDEPTNAERAPKKVKKSKVKADISTGSVNGKPGNTHDHESSPPPALRSTPASKRKSVSFTPDTKTKDGDSVKGLYKTWITNQIATDPSFDPSTVSPALRSILPSPGSPSPSSITSTSPATSEPTTKANNTKPPKKPKTRLPKTSSGPGPSRFNPVLTYLTAHHKSPQTWKFSKPYQNQILKHLFSLTHIPSSYDTALLPYIRGLKGPSARSRVRKEALAVREQDDKWLASEEPSGSEEKKMENETVAQCIARRRRDYEAAVARIKETLREREEEREERDWELLGEKEEWEARIRKRRRAEIVLWNVGEKEEEVVEGNGVAALPQQDTSEGNAGRQLNSGIAQLLQAARDAGPASRLGRGVGMGMGGVEVIDAGGIAKSSRGKKVVFGDDGAAQSSGSNRVNGLGGANGIGRANCANGVPKVIKTPDLSAANGAKPKRKRKRKRRTGVPDDDDSSSSSSSSEDGEEEERKKKQRTSLKNAAKDSSSDDETSSSGSGSGTSTSSSEDSDSE